MQRWQTVNTISSNMMPNVFLQWQKRGNKAILEVLCLAFPFPLPVMACHSGKVIPNELCCGHAPHLLLHEIHIPLSTQFRYTILNFGIRFNYCCYSWSLPPFRAMNWPKQSLYSFIIIIIILRALLANFVKFHFANISIFMSPQSSIHPERSILCSVAIPPSSSLRNN